ncbi:MAG: hypothetical protein ACRCSK_04325 [Fusobacteriaceae bacterium]
MKQKYCFTNLFKKNINVVILLFLVLTFSAMAAGNTGKVTLKILGKRTGVYEPGVESYWLLIKDGKSIGKPIKLTDSTRIAKEFTHELEEGTYAMCYVKFGYFNNNEFGDMPTKNGCNPDAKATSTYNLDSLNVMLVFDLKAGETKNLPTYGVYWHTNYVISMPIGYTTFINVDYSFASKYNSPTDVMNKNYKYWNPKNAAIVDDLGEKVPLEANKTSTTYFEYSIQPTSKIDKLGYVGERKVYEIGVKRYFWEKVAMTIGTNFYDYKVDKAKSNLSSTTSYTSSSSSTSNFYGAEINFGAEVDVIRFYYNKIGIAALGKIGYTMGSDFFDNSTDGLNFSYGVSASYWSDGHSFGIQPYVAMDGGVFSGPRVGIQLLWMTKNYNR